MSRSPGPPAENGNQTFRAQVIFTVIAVALATFATRLLAAGGGPAGAFALTTGLAFALLVRFGHSVWPAIFVGGTLGALGGDASPSLCLVRGLALTLQVLPATARLPLFPSFRIDRPRDAAWNLLLLLLVSIPAGAALSSSMAGAGPWPATWLDSYLMEAGGLIVIGLPLLFWRHSAEFSIPREQRSEAALAVAALVAGSISIFVFAGASGPLGREPMLAYLPVIAVLWLSLRFHVLAAAASLLFLVSIAWIATAQGHGPIAASPDVVSMLRIYLATLSAAVFFIILMRRREKKEDARRVRNDLEFRLMAERSREIVFRIQRYPSPAFEFLSPSIRELTGYSHEEFLSDPTLTLNICHPDDRPLMQYALHGDEPEMTTELRWKNREGEYRWVELYQVALFDRYGRIMAVEGTGRDITERKRAEQNILHLNRLLLALREIGQLMARVHEPEDLLNGVCGILVRNRGYRLVWIGIPGDGGLEPVAAAGDAMSWLAELVPAKHGSLLATSARQRSTGTSPEPGSKRSCISGGPGRSMLSVPLTIDERCYGWMSVCVDDTRTIDHEEEELLIEMGQDIAFGLSHMDSENARKRASFALQQSEEQYRLLVEEAAEGIFVVSPAGILTEMNAFGCSMLGRDRSDIIGRSIQDFLSEGIQDHADLDSRLNIEKRMLRQDGTVIEVEINTSVLPDGSIQGLMRDISERKRAEREIERLAFFDPLTGLANRRLLRDHLERDMAFMRRRNRFSGLLFLDLDHFKHINDSLGHGAGDQILQQVASRLHQELRAHDTIARLGGDEFVALLFDLAGNPEKAAAQAQFVAEKLLAALSLPYQISQGQFFITPSIGITVFPRDEQTIDDVLREADTAMYRSKVEGRNGFRFFQPEMQMAAEIRVSLEIEMRLGIQSGAFLAHYQPQVDAHGSMCGMEALLRWQHPERGIILPGSFISVAEETGLIIPLGEQLLEMACRQLCQWTKRKMQPPTLSINISARQFRHAEFVPTVRRILEATGACPERLIFEITETVFIDRVEESVAKMLELRDLGIRFSVDDFGTGYSSLTYLKRLPLDEIKIDRSFVQDSSESDFSRSIIRTILSIAHHLDMTVVAEGVEFPEQRDLLFRLGCHRFQGYLYGAPSPPEAYENSSWFEDHQEEDSQHSEKGGYPE